MPSVILSYVEETKRLTLTLCARCLLSGKETELHYVPSDPDKEPFAVNCSECGYSSLLSKTRREEILLPASA